MSIEDRKHAEDMDAVRRAYRGAARGNADMSPPAAIDDAIRAAARRAVQAGPQPVGKNWLRRWTPQFAVAAVVVLSVSVVMVSVEERPELAPAPIQKMALKQSAAPTADRSTSETQPVEAAPATAARAEGNKKKTNIVEMQRAQADAQKVAPRMKEERGAALRLESKAAPHDGIAPAPRAVGVTSAPPVFVPPAVPASAPSTTPVSPAPAVDSASTIVADTIAPARKELRADSRPVAAPELKAVQEKNVIRGEDHAPETNVSAAKRVVTSPAATAIAAPGIAAPRERESAAAPKVADSASRQDRANATARNSEQAIASAGMRGLSKDDIALAEILAEDERPGPWLKRLRQLHEQKKLKELREQLVRFKKAHPQVVLPQELIEGAGE